MQQWAQYPSVKKAQGEFWTFGKIFIALTYFYSLNTFITLFTSLFLGFSWWSLRFLTNISKQETSILCNGLMAVLNHEPNPKIKGWITSPLQRQTDEVRPCVGNLLPYMPSAMYGLEQSNNDSKFTEEGIISVRRGPILSDTMALQ